MFAATERGAWRTRLTGEAPRPANTPARSRSRQGETATQTGALASAPGDCTDGRLGEEVAVVRMAQLPNKSG